MNTLVRAIPWLHRKRVVRRLEARVARRRALWHKGQSVWHQTGQPFRFVHDWGLLYIDAMTTLMRVRGDR